MTYPWLEKWGPIAILRREGRQHIAMVAIEGVTGQALAVTHETYAIVRSINEANVALPGRARLARAAPALARALLGVEWLDEQCTSCGFFRNGLATYRDEEPSGTPHAPMGCSLDAALTEAGLPDQASREAMRVLLTECLCKANIIPGGPCPHELARAELANRTP